MCGICGFVGPRNEQLLLRMRDLLKHRGPDEAGEYQDDLCSLGHRRLAIIDLETGQQPMSNERGNVWIVLNGEIFNHEDLRRELQAAGHQFRSQRSDTETVLHAYEEWEQDCAQRLRGQFGFAVWDASKQRLMLARDHFGIVPLYYAQVGERLYFASEVKSLLACPDIRREIDHEALDMYLTFRYIPGPHTALAAIKNVSPSEWLVWEEGKIHREKYWRLQWEGPRQEVDREEAATRVRTAVEEAVRIRLMSDVPLGIFLSGGLDSTFVTAAAQKVSAEPVHTFSIIFPEDRHDESRYSRLVAEQLGTVHHEIPVGSFDTLDVLDDLAWFLDLPMADAAVANIYLMAKATKPHATVVLSGDGGDEVFGGYKKYRIFSLAHYFRSLGGVPGLERLVPPGRIRRAVHFWDRIHDPAQAYVSLYSCFTPEQKRRLYSGPMAEVWDDNRRSTAVCEPFLNAEGTPFFHRIQAFDLHSVVPDDFLLKADRGCMAFAVEGRVPYLDHLLVQQVFQLPPHLKIRWGQTKVILRAAQEGLVPDVIRRRRKRGFGTALWSWLENSSPEERYRIVGLEALEEMRLWNMDEVRRLLATRRVGWYARWQAAIFLFLSLWWRHVLKAV